MNKQVLSSYFNSSRSIPEPVSSFSFSSIQPGTLNQVSIIMKMDEGYEGTIDFGDGQGAQAITADGYDYTYTSQYVTTSTTYSITIEGNLGRLRKLEFNEPTIANFNLNDLSETGLTQLYIGQMTSGATGSINNLPSTLYSFEINSTGTTITGNPANLPANLSNLSLYNLTGLSGQMVTNTSHPDIWRLQLQSLGSGLTGSINNFPHGTRYLRIQSITTFTGSLDTMFANMDGLVIMFCFVIGNQITGTGAAVPPSTLIDMTLQGSSGASYSLNLNNFPNLTNCFWNTLGTGNTGAIESLVNASVINIANVGTTINYGGGTPPAWANTTITFHVGMTTANLDAFLNAWAPVAGTGTRTINLAGTNQARSAASNAAVTTLNGKGKTITTN